MAEAKRARHLHPAVVIGVVVVVALLAALPWLLGGDPVDEPAALPTPTPTTPEPTTPEPTPSPSPDATPEDAPEEPPEETTPEPEDVPTTTVAEGASLEGRVAVEDAAGDVTDTAGEAPRDPEPAVDLVEVVLDGEPDALTVTFRTAGPIPQGGPRSLVWSIELFDADAPRYTITVQQLGARRFAGILDWETLEQVEPPEPPEFGEREITIRVTGELLEGLGVPFRWRALGQLDGGYEDHVPDGEPATFP